MKIVRQTLIAVEKMKKNGDCIAKEDFGDTVTLSMCEGSDENTYELWHGNISSFEQCMRETNDLRNC